MEMEIGSNGSVINDRIGVWLSHNEWLFEGLGCWSLGLYEVYGSYRYGWILEV